MAADPVADPRRWTGIHTAAAVAAVGGPLLAPTFFSSGVSWTASPFPVLAQWVVVGLLAQVGIWYLPRLWKGTHPRPMSIVWATFAFFSFRPVWEQVVEWEWPRDPWMAAVVGVVLVVVGWLLGGRLDATGWVLLVALLVGAVVEVGDGVEIPGFAEEHTPEATAPFEAPDAVIIVVDSFPSPRALDQDRQDIDSFRPDLEALGFRVWDDARTNYTRTWMAVTSMLAGEYVVDGPFGPDGAGELHAGLGGGTDLMASAQAGGSRLAFHQAGWSLSRCDEIIDDCDRGLWRSETTDSFIVQTPLQKVFPNALAPSWTVSGKAVLEAVDQPEPGTIAMYHATLPHIPFLLDEECVLHGGTNQGAQRQIDCTGKLLVEAAERIDLDRTVVVIFGDHGWGFNNQLGTKPEDWSPEQTMERFGSFLAVSTPEGCEDDLPDPMTMVNVLPSVLGCDPAYELQPDRYFVSRDTDAVNGNAIEIEWPAELGP